MKGYVARKDGRYYAVVYEGSTRLLAASADGGIRPATAKPERVSWPPGWLRRERVTARNAAA